MTVELDTSSRHRDADMGWRKIPQVSLSQTQVEAIGRECAEPGWVTDRREAAYAAFRSHRVAEEDGSRSADGAEPMELSALALPGKWTRPSAGIVNALNSKDTAGKIILGRGEIERKCLESKWVDAGVIFAPLADAAREATELLTVWLGEILAPERGDGISLASAAYDLGAVLYVPEGVHLTKPLHSLFWMPTAGFQAWRLLVILGKNAKASLFHESASPNGKALSARIGLMEVHLGEHAELDFVDLQVGRGEVTHSSHRKALLDKGSTIRWATVLDGGTFLSADLDMDLTGEQSKANWTGISHLMDRQQARFTTIQHHRAPGTVSDLLLKVAHSGQSRSIWNGMVRMEAEACGSDGYQANRNLMVSEAANTQSHPGLEILTDDVRCSHGVTAGTMDPDELFYLLTRGFLEEDARAMLVSGFLETALARLTEEPVRKYVRKNLEACTRQAVAGMTAEHAVDLRGVGENP
jgi:Fe-S cluster assembly protein SufD